MDKKIIENIDKIPSFHAEMEKIETLLKKQSYAQAYQAVARLIEIACMDVLEEIYDERVEDSNIVTLASLFEQYHEKELKELLVAINGEYESIKLSKVKEIDVLSLLGYLDDMVKLVVKKYDNIF